MKEQIDTPTLIPTQTNSGVYELEQIEEMAECCPYFWNGACTVDAAKPTDCDLMCEMFGFMTSLLHADYRKQSEWISVTDRLPEDVYGKDRKKITVLVCTETGKVSTTSRQRVVKFNSTKLEWVELDTFEWSKRKRVTHWMPLPEPPETKGGAE